MDMKRILLLIFLLSSLALVRVCAYEVESSLNSSASLTNDGSELSSSPAPSRPVLDLEQLRVLELDQEGINWRQDWWKYLLMLLSSLLCLCLIVYLTKVLFWFFGVLICLGSALAGGIFLDVLFIPWLPPLLPETVTSLVSASLICHILGGLLGYAIAACLLAILFRPMKQKQKNG
jgi:hypothetical protein